MTTHDRTHKICGTTHDLCGFLGGFISYNYIVINQWSLTKLVKVVVRCIGILM